MNASNLPWGLKEDAPGWTDVPVLWGARMIVSDDYGLDMPYDRQGVAMDPGANLKPFDTLMNGSGVRGSRDGAFDTFRDLYPGRQGRKEGKPTVLVLDGATHEIEIKGILFRYSDRKSYGYLYVQAKIASSGDR